MRFLPKTLFVAVAFCALLLCGCKGGATVVNVAATADAPAFPPEFRFAQVRDETFHVATHGNAREAPHFVQNYIVNFYLKAGTSDRNLVLRNMQRESERKVRMVEKVLLENGYRKVPLEQANCEIVIRYGEGRRDGRRIELDETSPFSATVFRARADAVEPKVGNEAGTNGAGTPTSSMHYSDGKSFVPRAGKQIFPLGFLQISCDLVVKPATAGTTVQGVASKQGAPARRRVWEMVMNKKQKTDFDVGFSFLAYGVGKNLGRTTAGVKAMAMRNAEVQRFFFAQ